MQRSCVKPSPEAAKFDGAHELRNQLDRALHLVERAPARRDFTGRTVDPNVTAMRIRAILKARRDRDQLFPEGLFGDPAWDILLELYAAELSGQRISVGSLCVGAAVPATTALRWIKALEQKGFAVRHPDRLDGRRVYISLSQPASDTMCELIKIVPPTVSLM